MLKNVVDSRDNNFNLIRMLAATAVIFSHSFALATGDKGTEPGVNLLGLSLGYIAVDIFFITSGFLVCRSLCVNNQVKTFIFSRCLRIYPALIVSTLICCIMGGILSEFTFAEFIVNQELREFIFYNSSMVITDYQELPGVFYSAPYSRSVNGSLWTLPWELRMYGVLIGLGIGLFITKKIGLSINWLSIVITVIAISSLSLYIFNHFYGEKHWFYPKFYRFTAVFFMGGAMYVLRKYITLNVRYFAVISCILVAFSLLNKDIFFLVYVLTMPYLVLCVAYIPKGKILNYNQLGDYSYGTYIYAWPIQQVLAISIVGITPFQMFGLAFVFTLLMSYFSWNFIEKPSMRLKRYIV